MKSVILKAGIVTSILLLGWSHEPASAETNLTTMCGKLTPHQNPTHQQMDCLLTNAALEENIPPEVVKGVATQENGNWEQFKADGSANISGDGGIGVMQITDTTGYDETKLGNDVVYNIQAGVQMLSEKYNQIYSTGTDQLPRINGVGRNVIENWYFPVMAYNGTKSVNSPLYQKTGKINTGAYQESVFRYIDMFSYSNDTTFAHFPFKTTDFIYDTNNDIQFKKMNYTVTDQMHASTYYFKKGDQVVVTQDGVHVHNDPSTHSPSVKVNKHVALFIDGHFQYDKSNNLYNHFVWYHVTSADHKVKGYLSTAYMMKKVVAPKVNPVNDQDGYVSGSAPAGVMVNIMNGTKLLGSATAGPNGVFKAKISRQKTGTIVTVTYTDNLNEVSDPANLTVHPYNGWFTQNGKRYHYTNGRYNTGWQKISGKWYYFYSSGVMAHDTKIGKYRLGHSGARL